MIDSVIPLTTRAALKRGLVLPAMPLALNAERRFDTRRQRTLCRYYFDAGTGGLAVGVHTTQFAIHDPKVGLLRPVLELVAEEFSRADASREVPLLRVGGIFGPTSQAVTEATMLRDLGYHAGLLHLGALRGMEEDAVLAHTRAVGKVIPLFGFYLAPSLGGRLLSYDYWRRFLELDSALAIKIAVFDRYRTIDVMRASADSGREDVPLYTGNDDNIVLDLLTPFRFACHGKEVERRMVGGLLAHWAVWTREAVKLLERCHAFCRTNEGSVPIDLLRIANEVTDTNAALFDPDHDFAGCIPCIHEVLCRQTLLQGRWCLDPKQDLSPGQEAELDRVLQAYPHDEEDAFIAENIDRWRE